MPVDIGGTDFQLLASIADLVPSDVAVIIDGRRGDISNTAAAYARAFFDYYRVCVLPFTLAPL